MPDLSLILLLLVAWVLFAMLIALVFVVIPALRRRSGRDGDLGGDRRSGHWDRRVAYRDRRAGLPDTRAVRTERRRGAPDRRSGPYDRRGPAATT